MESQSQVSLKQYLENHQPQRKRTRLTIGEKKDLITDAELGLLTKDALAAK